MISTNIHIITTENKSRISPVLQRSPLPHSHHKTPLPMRDNHCFDFLIIQKDYYFFGLLWGL